MKKAPKRKIKKVPGYIGGGTTLNYELGDPIIAAPKKKKEKSLMDKIDEGAGKVAKFGFSTAIPIAVGALAGPGAGAAAEVPRRPAARVAAPYPRRAGRAGRIHGDQRERHPCPQRHPPDLR